MKYRKYSEFWLHQYFIDPDINELMVPWKKIIDVKANTVLGTTLVTLSKVGCYYKECTLGNFVADSFVFYVSFYSSKYLIRMMT